MIHLSFKEWLADQRERIDAVLLDIDGVLMTSRRPLPNALDTIAFLRRNDVPFLLLTNDGCNSPREKAERLRDSGFQFSEEDIVSSGHALADVVSALGLHGRLFFVAGTVGDPCYAIAAGLRVTREISELPCCKGAIIGEKRYDWEATLSALFNFLMEHPEAPLIVPNPDICFRVKGRRYHPASGATSALLQTLCNAQGRELEPIFLGKPYSPIFNCALRRLRNACGRPIPADRILIVGDSLAADIAGGNQIGCRTALVLTGLTDLKMLGESEIQPTAVFQTL